MTIYVFRFKLKFLRLHFRMLNHLKLTFHTRKVSLNFSTIKSNEKKNYITYVIFICYTIEAPILRLYVTFKNKFSLLRVRFS